MAKYIIDEKIIFFPAKYQLECENKVISLNNIEVAAFTLLCKGFGNVIARDKLIETLWPGEGREGTDANLNKCILNLRRKLSTIGYNDILVTVPRVGYKLNGEISIKENLTLQNSVESIGVNDPKNGGALINKKLKVTLLVLSVLFIVLTFLLYKDMTSKSPSELSKKRFNNITYYHPAFNTDAYVNDNVLGDIERKLHRHNNDKFILIKTDKSSSIISLKQDGKNVTAAHTVYYTDNNNMKMCEVSNFIQDKGNVFQSISKYNRVLTKISLNCDSKHWVGIETVELISNQNKKYFYWTLLGRDENGLPLFKINLYGTWITKKRKFSQNNDPLRISIISKEIELINPYSLPDNQLIPFLSNELIKNDNTLYVDVLENEGGVLTYRINLLDSVPIIYKFDK